MDPNPEPITGWERDGGGATPYRALCEFYRAFNAQDIALMARNWSGGGEVAAHDAAGGIRRGWPAIRALYERIFEGPAQVRVEYLDYTMHEAADLAFTVGRERGYLRWRGEETALAIRTSRLFRRIGGRWRQVHHHGSIDDPQLLALYRTAVLAPTATVAASSNEGGCDARPGHRSILRAPFEPHLAVVTGGQRRA